MQKYESVVINFMMKKIDVIQLLTIMAVNMM